MDEVDEVLRTLIADGTLPVGTKLTHQGRAGLAVAVVVGDGLRVGDHTYLSASDAANAASHSHVNGWEYWKMPDGQPLGWLRNPDQIQERHVRHHAPDAARDLEPQVIALLRRGLTQGQIGAKLGLGDNSMLLAKVVGRAEKYLEMGGERPTRGRTWNDKSNSKRQREISEMRKAAGGYSNLIEFQYQLNRAARALEGWDGSEHLKMDDVARDKIMDVYDDLVTLAEWSDRKLSQVQAWLGDDKAMRTIMKLRDVTGRTPEEAETALRLADRLEAKLSAAGLG